MEAEPSLRKRPSVSFSRHMSLMALAVFPVSFLEWTNTRTWRKQVRVRKLEVRVSLESSLELQVSRLHKIIIVSIFKVK